MGHCSCCAHTHECAPEKHIEKQESIFSEYWKVGLSFILLISGIVMNALDFTFFREGYFSLIWYIVAYLPVGLPVMKEAWESIKDKDYFSEFTDVYSYAWSFLYWRISRRSSSYAVLFHRRTVSGKGC